eukprot:CAMPEP_0116847558 /NCGR_PEP_ID=MMETSP0418-20121206/14502_1 /TAXON_ID=1158023 /ORGANISM="Astrosyne radiata, Strain 13vi08-1A" /LENGTH=162 /DNA_ID=CAMNT_0004479019 /DNA_START=66 /DNA_END=554 /DNA_ORIENTATION=-
MGETESSKKKVKEDLDGKLQLAAPNPDTLEELAVLCAKDPSPDNTFQYAFCLSKSTEEAELRYAITILDGLVKEGYEHQYDCMYGSATALYLLKDYEKARQRCESILRSRPESRLAKELHLASMAGEEEEQKKQVQKMTMGTVAVAALGVAGVVAGALLSKR